MKLNRMYAVAVAVGVVAMGTITPEALASPGSGLTVTTLVTSKLDTKVRLRTDRIRFETKGPTDIRVQNLVFTAGAVTGWHHHPGIVLVAVQSGAVTLWDAECHPQTYGPGLPNGAVFTESGDDPGQVTSENGASVYATFVVPRAEPPVFRVEHDPPPCV